MSIHTKAATAVLTGMALLALSTKPAAANSVNVQITVGQISLYGPFSTTAEATINLVSGVTACTSSAAVTATGTAPTSGTITVTISSVSELLDPFGPPSDYLVDLEVTLTGTYTDDVFLLTGSAVAVAKPLTGDCTANGEPQCDISATDLEAAGELTTGTFPSLVAGDEGYLSGGNTDIDVFVVDSNPTQPVCGGFTAVDFGSAGFNAQACVLTVPVTCAP